MDMAKQIIFKLTAVALGFALALCAGELALRIFAPQLTGPVQNVYHPQLGLIPVPNQHGRRVYPGVYDYTYTNNSAGLRGSKEYSYRKVAGYRILALGDSFAYGVGVEDDQTFSSVLERKLSGAGGAVEVINAGNPGKGTDYALTFFQHYGRRYDPDLTVLCFFSNDFLDNGRSEYYDVGEDGTINIKEPEIGIIAKKSFILRHPAAFNAYSRLISWSHLVNFSKQSVFNLHTRAKQKKRVGTMDVDDIINRNRKLTGTFISHLKKEVENSGSDFVVFFIPLDTEVLLYREKQELSDREKDLMSIVEALDATFFSLTPVLGESEKSVDRFYFRKEGHWKPAGHRAAAEFMARHVEKRLEKKTSR